MNKAKKRQLLYEIEIAYNDYMGAYIRKDDIDLLYDNDMHMGLCEYAVCHGFNELFFLINTWLLHKNNDHAYLGYTPLDISHELDKIPSEGLRPRIDFLLQIYDIILNNDYTTYRQIISHYLNKSKCQLKLSK